tara:strand:+ start:6111 stop:6641 length:531 start_codon:yes stop_codon:yes gene_type:complete
MIIVKKKTYNQIRDKKKICPNCNNKVFNATVICKNIKDEKTCFYMHPNKRTPEYIREIINSMDYDDREKYFKLFENNKKKTYRKGESIVDIVNKIYNPFKKNNGITTPRKVTTPRKKINKKEIKNDNLEKGIYFITKKSCIKNLNFIKQTIKLKNKLYKDEWVDDTFDNLTDIESI